MNKPIRARELPYEARARIADNLFLQRKRAGYSQEALGERAMVSSDRVGAAENGKVNAMLDTYGAGRSALDSARRSPRRSDLDPRLHRTRVRRRVHGRVRGRRPKQLLSRVP
jgi:hypothetical protein